MYVLTKGSISNWCGTASYLYSMTNNSWQYGARNYGPVPLIPKGSYKYVRWPYARGMAMYVEEARQELVLISAACRCTFRRP